MITMDCIGHVQVANSMIEAVSIIQVQVPSALMAGGILLERRMKTIIVEKDIIDTGNMLNSTSTEQVDEETVDVGAHTEYAIYQEEGTSVMEARPFARPALVDTYPEINRLLGAGVVTALRMAGLPVVGMVGDFDAPTFTW